MKVLYRGIVIVTWLEEDDGRNKSFGSLFSVESQERMPVVVDGEDCVGKYDVSAAVGSRAVVHGVMVCPGRICRTQCA